jgi:hypothetical protein
VRLVLNKVIWRYWRSHLRHHLVAALEEKLDEAKRERTKNISYLFVAAFQDLPLGTCQHMLCGVTIVAPE